MKIDDAIAAIKEFFLEILGFLLPGFTLLLLSYLFLKNEFKTGAHDFLQNEHSTIVIMIISYITGYVLYGISEFWHLTKEWAIEKYQKVRKIENKPHVNKLFREIKETSDYKVALEIIHEKIGISKEALDKMPVRAIRNIALSYIPEADRKIYNFMFRSELSEKVSLALIIIFFLGILSWLTGQVSPFHGPFKTDHTSMWLYSVLFIAAFFLRKTCMRFYSIAMRIAIPIFIVKYKMQWENNKKGNGEV